MSTCTWGSKGGTVVRALASHQCGLGSNPDVDAICGLSLLLVLSLSPRGFPPGTLVFPSPQKPTLSNSNLIWNARTRLNEFIWTLKCFVGKKAIYIFYTVNFRLLARSFTAIVPYFPTGTMEREEVEGRVATAKVHWGGGHTLKKCSYLTAIYCVLPQCLLNFGDRLCDTLQGWGSLSMKDYTHPYEWRATLFED